MLSSPSRVVARPKYLTAIIVLSCFAFVGAGLAFAAMCDGGISLILFGVAVALLGYLLYSEGAWATIIPFAIITFALVAGGWYGASVAGCLP